MFKRIQSFEIQDFSWLPSVIRDGVTDYLQFLLISFKVYAPVKEPLKALEKKSKIKNIIDLCSGAGGPSPQLAKELPEFKFYLTDLYPNPKTWQYYKKNSENIDFIDESINAYTFVPKEKSIITLYTSFHHFDDTNAKKILKNAMENKCPICINEFVQRDIKSLLLVIPSPLFMLLLIPFVRPFKFSRLFFTYFIPLIPLITLWDIIITVLRIRTQSDLLKMVEDMPQYQWEYQEYKTSLFMKVSSFIGYPKNE